MQLKTLFLLANAMAFVAAVPAPVPAVADDVRVFHIPLFTVPSKLTCFQNACYYKRSLSTWVKRAPGGAEIACGGSEIHRTFHNDEKRATVEAENQACYYKRSTSGVMEYVKRVAGGAEIACGGGGVHIDGVERRGPAMEGVAAADVSMRSLWHTMNLDKRNNRDNAIIAVIKMARQLDISVALMGWSFCVAVIMRRREAGT